MTDDKPNESDAGAARSDWKRLFLRGLALLLPTVLTILILVKAYHFVDEYVIRHVNGGIQQVLENVGFDEVFGPKDPEKAPQVPPNGQVGPWVGVPMRFFFYRVLGFLVSILFVCMAGLLIGTLVGRRVWHAIESRLMRFPVIRFVYPFIRQVTDFVFSERKLAYRSVVVVEYPRKGVWSVGFLTGAGFPSLQKAVPHELVSVFVPSSPTPMTGYLIFVRAEDISPLDITVDEAFRLVVSGGVIKPGDQRMFTRPGRQKRIESPTSQQTDENA